MDQSTNTNPKPAAPTPAKSNRTSAFDLFTKSIEALKVNLPQHLAFYFAPMIVGVVLFMVMLSGTALYGSGAVSATPSENISDLFGAGLLFSLLGFVLAMIVVNAVAFLANTYTGLQSIEGKKTDFQTAVREGAKHIVQFVLVGALIAAVVIAGFMLFVIPGLVIGVYLWPRLMILMPVMMRENLKGIEALKRSHEIVKAGGIWEVAGVFLLISLLGIIPILGALAAAALTFLYSLAPFFRVQEAPTVTKVATATTAETTS